MLSSETQAYLLKLISPPPMSEGLGDKNPKRAGDIPVVIDFRGVDPKLEEQPDASYVGALVYGTPTEDQASDLYRCLEPGGFVLWVNEKDFAYKGACTLEDTGFEIRDTILIPTSDQGVYHIPKPGRQERDLGVAFTDGDGGADNTHSTVKPVKLMGDLLSGIPQTGLVLDPFMGSGTTGVAAVKGGWDFVGIELDPKHVAICDGRVRYAAMADQPFRVVEIESEHNVRVDTGFQTLDDLLT